MKTTNWTGWKLSEVEAVIADLCDLSAKHDANGDEEYAQACIDAVWEARIVRQSMQKARAINLRARLG